LRLSIYVKKELPLVVLVGGGGHCNALIDVIEAAGALQIAGIVDLPERRMEKVLGYDWIGRDEDLAALAQKYPYFLVAAGQLGLPTLRERLFDAVVAAGGRLPTVCSPRALVSRHATLGAGSVVLHHAVVNAGAKVGANVIINTAALVEHDAKVGDHCHISTAAVVNGDCQVADRCFIGSGAVLRNRVCLAEGTVVGAGAVVARHTEPFGLYVGVPARRVKDLKA
jgi:sugar O-acyltransferase (sialic acid O-acetyltransferase NeuD family)